MAVETVEVKRSASARSDVAEISARTPVMESCVRVGSVAYTKEREDEDDGEIKDRKELDEEEGAGVGVDVGAREVRVFFSWI